MNNNINIINELLNLMADDTRSAEIIFSSDPNRQLKGTQVRVKIKSDGRIVQKSIVLTGYNDNLGTAYHLKELAMECKKTADESESNTADLKQEEGGDA